MCQETFSVVGPGALVIAIVFLHGVGSRDRKASFDCAAISTHGYRTSSRWCRSNRVLIVERTFLATDEWAVSRETLHLYCFRYQSGGSYCLIMSHVNASSNAMVHDWRWHAIVWRRRVRFILVLNAKNISGVGFVLLQTTPHLDLSMLGRWRQGQVSSMRCRRRRRCGRC